MPIPPQDAADLKAQGWTDEEIANAVPVGKVQQGNSNQSNTQAAINTLKANAGGIVGGGAGGIAGGAILGALAGSEFPVVGNIIGGIAGGLAGAYGGQKAQQDLQSDATNQSQQLLAQQAAEQHPITSGATDIIASALAGGGKPSLKGISRLLSGSLESPEAKQALFQGLLNPAIQTGTSVAEGQGVPSLGTLASSTLGGAAFSKTWLPHVNEPSAEVSNSNNTDDPAQSEQPPKSAPLLTTDQTDSGLNNNQNFGAETEGGGDMLKKGQDITYPTISSDIIKKVIDKGATKPIAVQRIFPELKLSTQLAQYILDKANEASGATLNHGDEVNATMPDGTEVHGWVNSIDEAGNPTLWTDDGKKVILPEAQLSKQDQDNLQKQIVNTDLTKQEELNANTIASPVETVRSETPTTTPPVAEGKPSGVQTPPENSTSENKGLPTKEEIGNIPTREALQSGYDKYNNQARQSLASGDLQKGVNESTVAQWHREELQNRLGKDVTPETKVPFGRVGKFFQNAIDRAREVSGDVADAYHRFFNDRSEIDGAVYGKVKNVMEATGFSKNDGKRLMEAMRLEERNNTPIPMGFFKNQAQKAVWNKYKQVYKEQGLARIRDKQPVIDAITGKPRLLRPNESSHPIMINPKVVDTIRANTDKDTIAKLSADFLNDQKSRGIDPERAKQNLAEITAVIQGRPLTHQSKGNLNYFNANRRAQGIPLPESWSRKDFEQNLQAFSARNASDRAHFRNIESNHSVMRQLGESSDPWGQPLPTSDKPNVAGNASVKKLIESAHGEMGDIDMHNEKALSSLFTGLFISSPALSGVHIPIANTVASIGLAPNPVIAAKMVVAGIRGVGEGIIHARQNGILRINAKSAGDMVDSSLNTAERIQAFASVIRKISTLNDLVTKATVGYTQMSMESLIPSKITRANIGGDKTAQQWLRHLDPDYKIGKTYTPEEVSQLASRATTTIHGSGDARTMPAWMLGDSELSGFFSLAHWSVGQTDRFMKDIYTPAKNGDYAPLLMTTFGALAGGYLIKKLREDISGKKSQIPSLSEIASSEKGVQGNLPLVAYNMMAAIQYSGMGGMFSQIAKYPFDLIYKNKPQGATFPLDEIGTDAVTNINNIATAIGNDPNFNWVDGAQAFTSNLLVNNFRLGREAYYQAINHGMIDGVPAEKKELSDKLGQLRRFEMVSGLPYNEVDQGSNPYMNLEQKKFKLDQDLPSAIQMVPGLVTNIIKNYSGTPDVMMNKLKALKVNDYAVFPSLEDAPLSFSKYISFLNKEEGPTAATAALTDYMKHKAINEAKASVVP